MLRSRFSFAIPLLAAVAVSTVPVPAQEPAMAPGATVYLLRHAEKIDESDESGLTAVGEARAKALAELLAGEPIVAVLTSQYRRTQLTVMPLLQRLGTARVAKIEAFEAHDYDGVVARLRKLSSGQAAVVSGHSNTIPVIAARLGVESPPTEPEVVYGDLYVVRLRDGRAVLERRRYGDP
jgi:broad specificity phosphatase PhoE